MSGFNISAKSSTLSSALLAAGKGSPGGDNNNEWDFPNPNVFSYCQEMMDDTMQPGMSSVQSGLDGHLPLLHASQGGLLLDLASPDAYLHDGSLEFSDSDANGAGPLFERRKRSRSNSSRHRFGEVVTELGPEEVRWFYKEDKKTWKAFLGHDSLKIEQMFRRYYEMKPAADCEASGGLNGAVPVETRTSGVYRDSGSLDASTVSSDERDPESSEASAEPVCVRGGLYEVDIKERKCYPVYWKREHHADL